MSELKATTAQEIVQNEKDCDYMDELFGGVKMPPTQVYIKSEADKVIAHNKYKRCLVMANWCFDEGKGTPTVYEVRTFYWGRWGNIWLALAEDPTWAKFLQLIHKETK